MKLTIPIAAVAVALSGVSALPIQAGVQDLASTTGFAGSIFTTLTSSFKHMFSARLIQTAPDQQPYWTTEMGKQILWYRGIHFMDLTDTPTLGQINAALAQANPSSSFVKDGSKFPESVSHQKQLKRVFQDISQDGPRAHLEKFTSFHTRYYKSETGRQSQAWLLSTVSDLVKNHSDFIKVEEFPHPWGQNSILLKIKASDKRLTDKKGVTILGAHQDSTNLFPFFAAPGADDDGSGTVTIIEALRVLLLSHWRPESDVELHWYSAEEGGLLGSQAVAQAYERKGIKVHAMLQQDMTAFVKTGTKETVGLVADFVSQPLTKFIGMLVDNYLDIGYTHTKLGYAGSDHASWTKIGADSAFAIEATFENSNLKRIHTTQDTFDHPEFSFEHLMQFVRLSASFVVELAGWSEVERREGVN
ncbi:related to bacterial leucyl aminopeptidase precursor [Melanopsichium pennsylvanicum]|uniref:Peptide hydrolase n=2 Tax=Melanopsichium pennsylvanicum TaxID=63383 RepID=A0AAJ5C511_9BASI|nr:related to bacterial leucyl aminopeptidase precursor [Melanopsichium pennsylvanicum 4]SNX84088.1 related to bacterial leucyl aminopeptidase precursor [Melanopsichium pennsylvanicum]